MLLHRIQLDPRCREARRDLADPYQFHATLSRAFAGPDAKCPPGTVLWRLEPESGREGSPRVIVQSQAPAEWDRIGVRGWLARADPAIDLGERLRLSELESGQRFRFRLRANPCVTRNRKRLGLMQLPEQEGWIVRKGSLHGFALPALAIQPSTEGAVPRPDVCVCRKSRCSADASKMGMGFAFFQCSMMVCSR